MILMSLAIKAIVTCTVIEQLSLNTTVIEKIESYLDLKIDAPVEIVLN